MYKTKTFLSFLLFTSLNIFYSEASLDLYLFNVGHGNFILLKDNGTNEAFIVDAGSKYKKFSEVKNNFKEALGNASLKATIRTHDHDDHKNFLTEIENDKDIHKSEHFISISGGQEIKEEDINKIKTKNLNFEFLTPKEELSKFEDNDQSLVFSVSYKEEHILFTGDATGVSFSNFLTQYEEEDIERIKKNRDIVNNTTLYIMPHHSSSSEDSWRWTLYMASNAELKATFICCAPNGTYQLPQEWIRDIPWPNSMKDEKKRPLNYFSGKDKTTIHEKYILQRIYMTGLASSYNENEHHYLHLNIDDNGTITYPDSIEQTSINENNNDDYDGLFSQQTPNNKDGRSLRTPEKSSSKKNSEMSAVKKRSIESERGSTGTSKKQRLYFSNSSKSSND